MAADGVVVDPLATQLIDWAPHSNPFAHKKLIAAAIDDSCFLQDVFDERSASPVITEL